MQHSPSAVVSQPYYRVSPKPKVFAATFPASPSTPALRVEAKRARRYPGLASDAPDTRALYRGAAELLGPVRSVLDFGCGAGLGSAELAVRFERVGALDAESEALEFAREYLAPAQGVELFELAAAAHGDKSAAYAAACVVDVLGHVASPALVLRNARRRLADGARLFIAEPLASPTQALMSPVLRAFSRPGLTQLLSRSGWEVERWVDGVGYFASCIARPSRDDAWLNFERGDAARERGDWTLALAAYADAARGASPAIECEALLGTAEVQAARGELSEACRCLLEAARAVPGSVRALGGLAELALLSGDPRQALSLAVRALEHDPCDVVAMQALARGADALEQTDALASWRMVNALAPADLAPAIELGRLAAARGELSYAIWVLERVRSFRNDLVADFHVTLGWLYLASGRLGEARLEAEIGRVKEPESSALNELWAQLELSAVRGNSAPHVGHAAE